MFSREVQGHIKNLAHLEAKELAQKVTYIIDMYAGAPSIDTK